ncbi:MAG: hypothetical protein ITG00_04530 [Flavobacterium sp.]|nr:hypothetical protein [Flavobacterium sp.]
MAAKQTTLRLHQDIRKEFEKLSNVREHGVRKFTNEYIFKVLAVKFYKASRTIENIVFSRTEVATTAQTSLFTSQQ